jgi:hypothetical protein
MDNFYFLNGQNLQDQFSIIPAQGPGSNIALTGAWDMPVRDGKTHYEWPDDNSIEPYLRADEIFFKGRDLVFSFYIRATDRRTAQLTAYKLYDFIKTFTGPVEFNAGIYGTYQVVIKDEIKMNYLADGFAEGTMTMRQEIVNMAGYIPPADNINPSIDKISLESLGFVLVSMTDQYNRPAMKSGEVTAYGYERVKLTPTGARAFNLELAIQKTGYQFGFRPAIQSLIALLSAPNARTLTHNGITREFFCKDGFKVDRFNKRGEVFTAVLTIPCTEIRVLETWNLLTDASGLILTDASGVPITEIIKMN